MEVFRKRNGSLTFYANALDLLYLYLRWGRATGSCIRRRAAANQLTPPRNQVEPTTPSLSILINRRTNSPRKKVSDVHISPPQQVDYGQWRTPTDTLLASSPSPTQTLLLLPSPPSRPGQVGGMVLTCEEFQNMFLDGRWWSSIIPRRSYWQH